MPTEPTPTPPKAATPPEPKVYDLTLEEFCARKSISDLQVELLGGFFSDERREGRVRDSEENFEARYLAFASRPA